MNVHDEDRIKELLKRAVRPVENDAEPARDLWPAVLRRIDSAAPAVPISPRQNWFDWALVAGLVIFAVAFPTTIPVFLYYL